MQLLAAFGAGAMLPLAFAPFGLFWIAPLSWALLFWLWRDASPGRAFALGTAHGLGGFGFGTYWTFISVHEFGEVAVPLAAVISGALIVVLALFVGAVGWAAARGFSTAGALAALVTLPALSLLAEWCRGWFLTGFGWLSSGYSQTDSWLAGYAPVLGQHGMSLAVFVTAGALVALVAGTRLVRAAALAIVAAVWGAGALLDRIEWTEPTGEPFTVALAQGAVEQDLKWRPEQLAATLEIYRRLTEQSVGADLILWPEAAIAPALYEQVGDYLAGIESLAARHGSVVLLGTLRGDPRTQVFENVLVSLTEPRQVYVKRHLVPFGEYFPVPDFVRTWLRLMSLPYTDITAGGDDQPLIEVLGQRIAVTICYEDVFGEEQLQFLPEATLLVNVSNDAWFGDSIAPHQHLQIARLRAAEVGRPMLRATNTGITALIDARGRVVERIPQFVPGVLEGTAQGYRGTTPYVRVGNWPVVSFAFAALAAQLVAPRLRRRASP